MSRLGSLLCFALVSVGLSTPHNRAVDAKGVYDSFRFRALSEKLEARVAVAKVEKKAVSRAAHQAHTQLRSKTAGADVVLNLNATCKPVHPTFCTMVDWDVNMERQVTSDTELMIQMTYHNMQGTSECRKEFKQLHCRYMYPKCKLDAKVPSDLNMAPCRRSCLAFAKRCPGANIDCESYPTMPCYDYKYLTPAAYHNAHAWSGSSSMDRWYSVIIGVGVLIVLVLFAVVAAKVDQNRKIAKIKAEREAAEELRLAEEKALLEEQEAAFKKPDTRRQR